MNEVRENYSVLLTDLYQLTMAYGYWKNQIHEREAVFHLFFRNNPFGSGYSVACGLAEAIDYLGSFQFDEEELGYLETLAGNDGTPLFERAFLDYLAGLRFTCDVDAIAEGTVVFPHEPLLRVRGPILQGQLIETALLNIINFQTLIATKAARVCQAAEGDPVLEFGLRRAQGIGGGMAASRAAYIGGCAATSNVLAGKRYGIPVKGTHAHSWIMAFDTEPEAFDAYAAAMPNNCVLLVDTYDTLQGVRHAVEIGKNLRRNGHKLGGIRLDSGNLAHLSIEARRILDEGGFPNAAIVASSDLDEQIITNLKQQGARINIWGVGTRLATAYDQPALGGVYKLAAMRDGNGGWQYRLKLSEQAIKVSIPGVQQVRRFTHQGEFIGDMIHNEGLPMQNELLVVDLVSGNPSKKIPADAVFEDLLVPIYRGGALAYASPDPGVIRERTQRQLGFLNPAVKQLRNPRHYPVGLEPGLHTLKTDLVRKARGNTA